MWTAKQCSILSNCRVKIFCCKPSVSLCGLRCLLRLAYNLAFDRLFLMEVNEWSSCKCWDEQSYTLKSKHSLLIHSFTSIRRRTALKVAGAITVSQHFSSQRSIVFCRSKILWRNWTWWRRSEGLYFLPCVWFFSYIITCYSVVLLYYVLFNFAKAEW